MFRGSKRVENMCGQCMRSESSVANSYYMQSSKHRGNQEIIEGMSFDNGLRCLKVKFDVIMLKVQLDTIMHEISKREMLMLSILII